MGDEGAEQTIGQWEIAEREGDSQVWHTTALEFDTVTRKWVQRQKRFVELGTGMNYRDQNGTWQSTREELHFAPDGSAISEFGPHRLVVANNLNSDSFIDFTGSDGVRLRCGPVAIGYYDPLDGRNVILATVRDTGGQLTAQNEITFPDGFAGLNASITVGYHRAGMSHALILNEGPAPPEAYGLSPRSRLELYTEFVPGTVAPLQIGRVLKSEGDLQIRQAMGDPDFKDAMLDFGAYKMGTGIGFELNGIDTDVIPVGKQFAVIDGRPILIEAIEYQEAQRFFAGLPAAKKVEALALNRRASAKTLLARHLPQRTKSTVMPRAIEEAKLRTPKKSFVLDYSLVSGGTNFTFANETYLVSSTVYSYGKTTISGGAVIKHTNSATFNGIRIAGPVECLTGPTWPAVFTSQNDNSVGETLPWSSGNPWTNSFGNPVLQIDYYQTNLATLEHLRVAHAASGLSCFGGNGHKARHIQAVRCANAFKIYDGDLTLQNVLVMDAERVFSTSASATGHVEHLTAVRVSELGTTGLVAYVTNSLLVAVTNIGAFTNSHTYTNSDPSAVFQTVGAGTCYLLDNTYRGTGTTNINSTLLSELRRRTTWPPILFPTNVTVGNTNLIITPKVERDDGLPDVGYHYAPLDMVFASVYFTNSSILITNGASVGTFTLSPDAYGIGLGDNTRMFSEGVLSTRS
jgi:hypothetical protein